MISQQSGNTLLVPDSHGRLANTVCRLCGTVAHMNTGNMSNLCSHGQQKHLEQYTELETSKDGGKRQSKPPQITHSHSQNISMPKPSLVPALVSTKH